jgi:DNA-binding response OmpR family regulator
VDPGARGMRLALQLAMSKRMLIVDDEDAILVGMRRYFLASGFDVDCAHAREEALDLLSREKYDCLIADLCLTAGHGPDGLELVAFSHWRSPKTRVVVLTAAATPVIEADARRRGADAVLRKPQPLTQVAHTVEALLAGTAVDDPSLVRVGGPSSLRGGDARPKKILIVDDSKTALFMETMILRQGPYTLITAADGEEAVRKADAEKPDLIVMDVVMPKMTGLEACQELKRRASTRNIPVILVTTRGETDHVEKGFESGCNDYLTKPVSAPALLAKARNYLGH